MFLKAKITEIFTETIQRYFKVNLMSNQTSNLVQFHSGGDDYCPLLNVEGLGGNIGNNPANGFIIGWRDDITRKSNPGEKRIYSSKINEETGETVQLSEVYLKNDGSVEISGVTDINITVTGNANINAATVNLGGEGGGLVLTENSTILDGDGKTCTITANTTKAKAV